MIEAARALGVAARFVSGYVYVPKGEDEPVRLGGGATHAWCQIYLPGAGWVDSTLPMGWSAARISSVSRSRAIPPRPRR